VAGDGSPESPVLPTAAHEEDLAGVQPERVVVVVVRRGEDVSSAYCPTCRRSFRVVANPPYAVIHVLGSRELKLESVTVEQPARHLHAVTREELSDEPAE